MALTEKTAWGLEQSLADGMCSLINSITACRQRNEDVLIVTVSRRMPHILFWYKLCCATPEQRDVLDHVEVVTEIALPFINLKSRPRKVSVFILDDVVYSGRTIRYVMDLVQDFTGNKNFGVYVFFCEQHTMNYMGWDKDDRVKVCLAYSCNTVRKEIRDFVSTIIALTLPIDVTYPLLYPSSDNLSLDALKSCFKDSRGQSIDNYSTDVEYRIDFGNQSETRVEKGSINRSYTSLLPSEISGALNNDFAKIRTYMRLDEYVVVPMAPNILSDFDLTNRSLFESEEYSNIWTAVLDYVDVTYLEEYSALDSGNLSRERVRNRCFRSLVSIANYLYSLSTFNRIVNQNKIGVCGFSLFQKDLELIIGADLTRSIFHELQDIIDRRIVSPRTHRKLNVEGTFIPKMYVNEYTFSKYMCISQESLNDDLMAIFRNAKDRKAEFPALLDDEMEYGVEGIMESFEGLEEALLIKDYERKVEINRWVDRKIDEGVIVSRYANVSDSGGKRYWRRFFRLTAMDS